MWVAPLVDFFYPATYQELLDGNHSNTHNFIKQWEGGTMQIGV